jgi:hypothetical protein
VRLKTVPVWAPAREDTRTDAATSRQTGRIRVV